MDFGRRSFILMSGAALASPFAAFGQSSEAFRVTPPVGAIDQGNHNTCWAVAWAMMLDWKNQTVTSYDGIAAQLLKLSNPKWYRLFKDDLGLPHRDTELLAADTGMKSAVLSNLVPAGWLSMLKRWGPLYLPWHEEDERSGHVIVVEGIDITDELSSTRVYFCSYGMHLSRNFVEFTETMEETARAAKRATPVLCHW